MSTKTQAAIDAGISAAEAAAPLLLTAKMQALFALAIGAMAAIQTATAQQTDVSDADLQALFAQYDRNRADDLAAQREAGTVA